jgi:putative MATE family efflux protein
MSSYTMPVTKNDSESKKVHGHTKGVKILLGEPKKAIIKLAIPMIIAMSANTIYNLVDAIWVAGLGPDALAAVGFFFPFLMVAMSISVGLGVGGAAAISRRIGSKDKKGADSVAMHTILYMIIISAIFSIVLFLMAEEIFKLMGAGDVTAKATAYARVLFGGSIVIFYTQVATAIFRAEGDVNRAMYALMLGAVLNIILDPIFIYTLNMGVVGAAWATFLSLSITCILLLYWMFFKKDTYVTFRFRGFSFARDVTKDIFNVGLPAMVMQLSMSISMIVITVIARIVGGTDAVATYTTGWRVAMIAILPLLGIATAVVSVTGAAYGARDKIKLKTSFLYAVKIGVVIEGTAALLTFVFAPQITAVFTRSEETMRIADDITDLLRIMAIFYPGVAFGMFSSSMFQGTGKGTNALIVTIVRVLILGTPLSYIFALSFNWGLAGVWWGMVIGNLLGSALSFTWGNVYIRNLRFNGKETGFNRESATKSK